jgi:hypothetical protein
MAHVPTFRSRTRHHLYEVCILLVCIIIDWYWCSVLADVLVATSGTNDVRVDGFCITIVIVGLLTILRVLAALFLFTMLDMTLAFFV